MRNRLFAFLLALCLLLSALPALAEEDEGTLTGDDVATPLEEGEEEEEIVDDPLYGTGLPRIGSVYQEHTLDEFDKNSPAIYTCMIIHNTSVYVDRDIESEKVFRNNYNDKGIRADVLAMDPAWAIVRYQGKIGYVKRHRIAYVEPVNKATTPPYGVQKHSYIAVTSDVCEVRKSMSDEEDSWVVLNPGTTISIWGIQDGWAIVNYWRTYGYINMNDLTDLVPVCPTDAALGEDMPIAAYTSYYKMVDTESNHNRIKNIAVGCQKIMDTGVLKPGQSIDCNKVMGPYTEGNGYFEAGVLANGSADLGYGGGTCQVSSTLYNSLLQLPGITILQRRAHGDNGAPYLPMGVDAAVGNSSLNLRFRNDYDFPIRFRCLTSGDGALCMLIYRADTTEDGQ